MSRGGGKWRYPGQQAALIAASRAGGAAARLSAAEGRAWARAWRERTRPYFDAIYGPEVPEPEPQRRCPMCGRIGQ